MYNTNLLNSAAECDALLNKMITEQDDLTFRKTLIARRVASFTKSAADIQADITQTQAEYDMVTSIIATLPDGDAKIEQIKKQKRLDSHLFDITHRKNGTTSEQVLLRELEVKNIDNELASVAAFITEVETRKSEF